VIAETPTFGRYVLGPRIAQGGMGEVFLATQTGMGAFSKPLVLKLMLPHLASRPRAIELFLAEARLASRMNHPNVVQIFDVGVIDGRYFIAMELVRGVSLARLVSALREHGEHLPLDLLLYVARALCDALHHAHEQRGPDGLPLNLVHRDVTLENVLVSTDGQVKLTDFGIARATTAPGLNVAGKDGYIAPEVLQGAEVDRRADIFGAAITLMSLAAVERPDERGHLAVPEQTRTPLPLQFVEALDLACSPAPGRRFASARQFRDALPPVSSADAADVLGSLVQRLCAAQMTQLDGDVQRTAAFSRAGTDALSKTRNDRPARPGNRRATWLLALALMIAALVVGVVAWSLPAEHVPLVNSVIDAGIAAVPEARPTAIDAGLAAAPETENEGAPPDAGSLVAVKSRPPRRRPPPQAPQLEAADTPGTKGTPTGALAIDATPWALVSIDGKPVGETPIGRYMVPAGTVIIDFVNPESGTRARRTVVVKAGATVNVNETLK
jgi:eukaryotic-like serine/threonine-protein kinase